MMAENTDGDPLLHEAIDLIRREGRASVSMLQRRMRIGYTRAARLVDVMEERRHRWPAGGEHASTPGTGLRSGCAAEGRRLEQFYWRAGRGGPRMRRSAIAPPFHAYPPV